MEIDVDDVPWKDELISRPPVIEEGRLRIPTSPGWGADLVESVARAHEWAPGRLPGYSDASMYRGER
jgi:L-alanine-DL-glutamate epimerase-like enolase superfamily enzyme